MMCVVYVCILSVHSLSETPSCFMWGRYCTQLRCYNVTTVLSQAQSNAYWITLVLLLSLRDIGPRMWLIATWQDNFSCHNIGWARMFGHILKSKMYSIEIQTFVLSVMCDICSSLGLPSIWNTCIYLVVKTIKTHTLINYFRLYFIKWYTRLKECFK